MTTSAFVPAEWATQKSLWTAWPFNPKIWQGDLLERTRGEMANMINAIAAHQTFYVTAFGDEAIASAQQHLAGQVQILPVRYGDVWLRDTGPIFTRDGRALRFKTNGWGEKFVYTYDDEIGDTIANFLNIPIVHHDFILEGGSIEHDGEGLLMTTRQCLLNKNRNGWTEQYADKTLKQAFNAKKIIWLDEGLYKDHTDGHVDNLARFVAPNKVLCQKAFGDDDPNAALYEKTANDLRAQGVEVVQAPSPGLIRDERGDIMPASHMNFIISNKVVVVPTYGSESTADALAVIAQCFPDRTVVGSPAGAILTGGGSFHCITQQQVDV